MPGCCNWSLAAARPDGSGKSEGSPNVWVTSVRGASGSVDTSTVPMYSAKPGVSRALLLALARLWERAKVEIASRLIIDSKTSREARVV